VFAATSYASTSTRKELLKQPKKYQYCRRSRVVHKQDEPGIFIGSYSRLEFVCYRLHYQAPADRRVSMTYREGYVLLPNGKWVYIVADAPNDPASLMNHNREPNINCDSFFRNSQNPDATILTHQELECDYGPDFDNPENFAVQQTFQKNVIESFHSKYF